MNLESFSLQIFNPEETIPFYIDVLGFHLLNEFSEDDVTYYNLCFENTNFHIQLKYTESLEALKYQEVSTDNYWKYSLFVSDIQNVYQELQSQNKKVGEPYQFGDIGYLSHAFDTENHQIEFIQKTFKETNVKSSVKPNKKEKPTLGLITIRTKDPIKAIKLYEEVLELKLLVRMYIDRGRGFTLYFLGDKNLQTPNPDIDAVENREWMYQQNSLFIEIQYYWGSEYDKEFTLNPTPKNGLKSINFSGDLDVLKEKLVLKQIPYQYEKNKITFVTNDQHLIAVENSETMR